ncbi:hypothetical protein [Kangiella sp.]|uniref:hypothetical protein n=1 Tax=Kangiella sp. TaxID=1920245 RepID=UPI003A933A8C
MFRYSVLVLCFVLFSCEQQDTSQTKDVHEKVSVEKIEVVEEEKVVKDEEVVEVVDWNSDGYVPFPDGYGYMENLKVLQQATDEGDRTVIRQHAWSLWAGIMQPDESLGWPLWFSWPNTKGAFENSGPGPIGERQSGSQNQSQEKPKNVHSTIVQKNFENAPDVDTPAPIYDLPAGVITSYPKSICKDKKGKDIACDGKNFVSNGDIMIATESLSRAAMNDIRGRKLYLQSTLDDKHAQGVHMLDLDQRWIVTKHMYWPVKAKGITALPVWKNNFEPSFTGYAGYEVWDTLVAIDPSGLQVGQIANAAFLYGVKDHEGKLMEPVKGKAKVYALDDFYFHKITDEDWKRFDEADKAILDAASRWANGKPIEVGDYLVTVAMHVNTKELMSWTLQSVWWSDTPNEGIYSKNRPELPQAQGPWDHYLLTDAYAVPANPDGKLDIAVNPYIEGVIHPVATNCRNCHVRAGWPTGKVAGTASYQNPDCPGLLDDLDSDSECLKDLTLTDYLWIIPDRAVKDTESE